MKIKLTLLFLTSIIIGCNSPEKKAKQLIEQELSKTMNDFKSYEPVEFGKLDSSFTYLVPNPFKKGELVDAELTKRSKDDKVDVSNAKKEFKGFSLTHTFRGKNGYGAMTLSQYIFYFDNNIEKIISTEEVKN